MSKYSFWRFFPYALLLGYVCFIGFALAQLNKRMDETIQYPLRIMQGAGEMMTRLKDMQNFIPGLVSNPDLAYEQIERILATQEEAQDKSFGLIRKHMPEQPELMEDIQKLLLEIRQRRREAAHLMEGKRDYHLAFSLYINDLKPQIESVYASLGNVYKYAQQNIEKRKIRTTREFQLCVILSVLVGFIIALAFYLLSKKERLQTKRLEARDKLFDELSQNVDEVFLISSGADGFDFASDNSARLLNINSMDIIRDPASIFTLMQKEDADWLRARLTNAELNKSAEERIVQLVNGVQVFKIGFNPITTNPEARDGAVITLRDQTHEWQQQQALHYALENANAASQAKSSFLSHMSHEIRTPMNAIIGMTTIAINKITDRERVLDCLTKIAESSKHLLNLINNVLDMSKIESGKLSINNESFSLPMAIQNINDLIRPQTQARQINFEITQENVDEEELIGDNLRLNQILLNILSNSVKFTPQDGIISLHIQQMKKDSKHVFLRFIITDTGIGMSREFLTRLFKPFEQATPGTTAKYGGTGLGMSITANLIALMGGSIQVESEPGKGSVFTIDLPFGYTDRSASMQSELPPLKVLVVDDDPGTCEHAALLLEKIGVEVEWVTSGQEAIELVKKTHCTDKKFDVCFIDWKMPGMDGEETARRIREVVGKELLIIIISAYDWGPIEENARAAGVNDFVAKPFFSSTLFDVLLTASSKYGLKAETAAGANSNFDFAGNRILLVEDNEFNREIANEFLNMVNARVENAENGQEAVEIFGKSQPGYYDMILMDVQMPVMNGYEATRAIRASGHPDAKSIPILAMTANAFTEDVANATSAGMNGHIAKPIDISNLYKAIAQFLQKKQ